MITSPLTDATDIADMIRNRQISAVEVIDETIRQPPVFFG